MDNHEATQILRRHNVDTFTDPRQPKVILEEMVLNGHLPGDLLDKVVTVERLPESRTVEECMAVHMPLESGESTWVM